MALLAWIPVFLVLQGGHSYILLTANLDDVQAIAKEMAASPVAGQLTNILRRASSIFNQQLRASTVGNEQSSYRSQPQVSDSSLEPLQDNRIERRNSLNKEHQQRHHKRSRTNDDQLDDHSRRFVDSQNRSESNNEDETTNQESHHLKTHESLEKTDKSNAEEQESHKDNLRENKEETKKDSDQEKAQQSSEGLEGKPKESDRSKERDEDDIKVERHEKRETRSHSDELVALGKNASVYLNSIKKIMEAI